MRRLAAICLVLLAQMLASPALAGAWAREDGTWFVAVGGNVLLFGDAARPVHYDPTIYLEYGLTPRLPLGLDGYTAARGDAGSLLGFVRWQFGRTDRPARTAVSLGYGATLNPRGDLSPTYRLGLHWGRGMEWGWVSVDYTTTFEDTLESLRDKADLTLGVNFNDRWTGILTAEAGIGLELDYYAKLSPSIVYHATERVSLRFGYTQALTGDFGGGIGMQVWTTF